MRAARFGSLLLSLGVLVGVAAGVGLLVGFEPARLPRVLLNIAAYKLTFLAALGLIAAGAIVLRYTRREELQGSEPHLPADRVRELSEGQPPLDALRAVRERERARGGRAQGR